MSESIAEERDARHASLAWGEWPSADLLATPSTMILADIAAEADASFCRAAIAELDRRGTQLEEWAEHRIEVNYNTSSAMTERAWDAIADARATYRMYRRALGRRLDVLQRGDAES